MARILSTHRKKMEPKRRYGSAEFRSKIKQAANYKRVFQTPYLGLWEKFWHSIGLGAKLWRWLLGALVLVIFYFLVVSPKLVVADITVHGNSQVPTQQIQDAISQYGQGRFLLIKKTDFFLMSRGRLTSMLIKAIPTIKDVTAYHLTWPDKLDFTVSERTPGFALQSNGQYFLVDDEGVIIKQIDAPGNLPVATDSVVEDFATDQSLPNQKMTPFIITMHRIWSTKISSPISSISFPGQAADEVEFTSAQGWTVYFDLDRAADVELNDLSLILSQQVPAKSQATLAYIDLRLSKWAYYCYQNTPCSQVAEPDNTQLTDPNATQ